MIATMMESLYIGGLTDKDLISLFLCDVDDDDYYDVIGYNIAVKYPEYLLNSHANFAGRRLRGALFGLSFCVKQRGEAASILETYLSHNDPLIMAEAIRSLAKLGCVNEWGRIEPFLNHPSPFVRNAALAYAAISLDPARAVMLVVNSLEDSNPAVRGNAVDLLGELGPPNLESYILPLRNDPSETVRQAVKSVLELMRD